MDRCLVIGNGKSLRQIPISFLKSYPTFGSNRIYLLDGFNPLYYACVNPLVIKQSIAEIKNLSSEKYIAAKYAPLIPCSIPLYSVSEVGFSKNPLQWIYEGYTITYVLLQLAYWKGYKEVGLVGVDHYYIFDGQPNQVLVADGDDQNHFHPKYFSDGTKWNAPDLKKSEQAYKIAKKVYEDSGRRIVNLTPGSKLEVFEREGLEKWLL